MADKELDSYADRAFSFYPPIVNIEHNEWRYEKGTWSEVLVHNTKTGTAMWVPRSYLREISQVGDPVMIVGLTTELEYSGGAVWPHKRRLVEMPSASSKRPLSFPAPPTEAPAKAPKITQDTPAERKIRHLVLGSLVVFIGLAALTVFLTRRHETGGTITYETILQHDLKLTADSDYYAVVRLLGNPREVRWRSTGGERQYQALDYPSLGVTVILMGPDRSDQRYIGAKDSNWKTVHYVLLPGGTDTSAVLRSLEKF